VQGLGDCVQPVLAGVSFLFGGCEDLDAAGEGFEEFVLQPAGNGAVFVDMADEDRPVVTTLDNATVGGGNPLVK
jgi:hypothetical protein